MSKFFIYLFFVLNLAVIFGFWGVNSGGLLLGGSVANILLSLGRISGLLLAFFVLIQVLLMGRTVWIEKLFGLDKLARVHHYVGYSLSIFLVLHPLLVVWSYALESEVSFWNKLGSLLIFGEDILGAAIGFVLFILVIISSITIARKKLKYESWYYVHLAVYIAILTAFGHQLGTGGDFKEQKIFALYWLALYLFVFTNLILFRFLRPIYDFGKHRFVVDKVVQETGDTYSIYIRGKNIEGYKFYAGQFAIFRFLAHGLWTQEHPFSFSQLPGRDFLRITIKGSGDYTAELGKVLPGTKVVIDGPYGIFTSDRTRNRKILLIAGGVGIAPVRAVGEVLTEENRDLVLLYANRREKDIIFRRELDEIDHKPNFQIHHVVAGDPDWRGEKGFIDEEKINRLVPDVSSRDIYLCGPKPMMEAMVRVLVKLAVPESRIYYEKFEL